MRVLIQSLRAVLVLTLLTGVLYPLAVLGAARLAFPDKSLGSRVADKSGKLRGSRLIGQAFSQPSYLWGRPSAAGSGYDAQASGASNVSPVGSDCRDKVRKERDRLVEANPGAGEPPLLLATASASGLDPHVSPEAALWQAPRIAKARGIEPSRVEALVREMTQGRTLGVLGEPRVSILDFNLELDRRFPR